MFGYRTEKSSDSGSFLGVFGGDVEWHIVTGEYPPKLGGVGDYTYQICRALASGGDSVHVWSPGADVGVHSAPAQIHQLPGGFGWRWLNELNSQLREYPRPRNVLIQYVPHMYGWKSMNLAFCWWIMRQRRENVFVMFHEIAFPLRQGQPLRHHLLALVHRAMAWVILRSVRHAFTSTDPYIDLLRKLGKTETPISMLRICSNIPAESYTERSATNQADDRGLFTVGIFSNFSPAICRTLAPVIAPLFEDPQIAIRLLGPGEAFCRTLAAENPEAAGRISCTGHLPVAHVGDNMQRCDVLLQLYPGGASAARGTLIGGMASGVPVITNSGAATDKLFIDSRALLLTDGTPQSVRSALLLLKGNPGLAREIAARAQRLYNESFQPAVIASRLREIASNHLQTQPEVVAGQPVSS